MFFFKKPVFESLSRTIAKLGVHLDRQILLNFYERSFLSQFSISLLTFCIRYHYILQLEWFTFVEQYLTKSFQ